MRLIILFFALLLLHTSSYAQDSSYARELMLKLGSNSFSGRGYINGGIDSAAQFISKEYKKIGLSSFGDNYFQEFSIAVNSINKAELSLNKNSLIAGEEFILDIHCKSISSKFSCLLINEKTRTNKKKLSKLSSKAKGKVLILTKYQNKDKEVQKWYDYIAYANPFGAEGCIILDSSGFTYSVAQYQELQNYFIAKIHPDAFPKKKIKKTSVSIETNYNENYKVKNIIGYLQGREYPDSFIVISAHYDHIGKMGDAIFPGGNDNASGVAMMLDLARKIKNIRFRPRYSLIFIAFASEETGLHGSSYLAENPIFELSRIRFMINLDMVGTGSEGITVVNGSIFNNEFSLLQELNEKNNYLSQVKVRGESCNSDHCPFYKKAVPAVFIYTMGKEHLEYHTIGDKAEVVPLTAYEGLFHLLEEFIYSL